MSDTNPRQDGQSPYDQQPQYHQSTQPVSGTPYAGQIPTDQSAGQYQYGQPYDQPRDQPYDQQYGGASYAQQSQYAQQYAYQQAPGQPYPPQGAYYPQPTNASWNVMCIVGFILSFVIAPAGLILSIVALVQINKTGEKSKGLSIAGIIIGAINTILIVAAIAFTIWVFDMVVDQSDYMHNDCAYMMDGECYDSSEWDDYIEDFRERYGVSPEDLDYGYDEYGNFDNYGDLGDLGGYGDLNLQDFTAYDQLDAAVLPNVADLMPAA